MVVLIVFVVPSKICTLFSSLFYFLKIIFYNFFAEKTYVAHSEMVSKKSDVSIIYIYSVHLPFSSLKEVFATIS